MTVRKSLYSLRSTKEEDRVRRQQKRTKSTKRTKIVLTEVVTKVREGELPDAEIVVHRPNDLHNRGAVLGVRGEVDCHLRSVT